MTPLSTLFAVLTISAALVHGHKSPHRRHNSPHDRARRNFEQVHEEEGLHSFDNRTLVERDTYTGIGTYYYTGLGACGLTSSDSDLMVAMNTDQYGSGYPGPQCFKYITIEAEGTTVSGIEVLDECPTCGYGSLDLSPGLFTHFAGTDAGTIAITWWFDGDSSSSTSTSKAATTTWTPTTTTSQWVAPSSSSSTQQWQQSSSTTSQWVASSSATPSSTTQWSQPAVTFSSTYTQTSTSSAASSTITSSTWSSVANSTIISSSAAKNTTNSFAVVASDTASASASSAVSSSSSSGSSSDSSSSAESADNLVNFNALVAQYGQLVVKAASG